MENGGDCQKPHSRGKTTPSEISGNSIPDQDSKRMCLQLPTKTTFVTFSACVQKNKSWYNFGGQCCFFSGHKKKRAKKILRI